MAKTIDISEAQTHLSELVSQVINGEEIILAEDERPVARLVAVNAPSRKRVAGLRQGMAWISEDFDAPLPDVAWASCP